MRALLRAGIAAIALTTGTVAGAAAPAQADVPAVLYVRQTPDTCSDTGPGSAQQPFCTISAAAAVVTAGQTVDVGRGWYTERVTIATSGTQDRAIVFRGDSTWPPVVADGFVIEGQQNIQLKSFSVRAPAGTPALDIRDSSAITVERGRFTAAGAPGVRLTGVAAALLDRIEVLVGSGADGVSLDATTTRVAVRGIVASAAATEANETPNAGVRVVGPGNQVINSSLRDFTGAAIAVEPGATATVVANNDIIGGVGYGIHSRGANGTAIANNTVRDRCRGGIRVDGTASGVSVQNNVLALNGDFGQASCEGWPTDGVELGIHDASTQNTLVDYNNAHHGDAASPTLYSWDGAQMGLAAFQAASGQAAHDRETNADKDRVDSANSAAPGYQAADRKGTPRADDHLEANTGAGLVEYADRGADEILSPPVARLSVGLNLAQSIVHLAAGLSAPGTSPIKSYRFSFGDGTTTEEQEWPAASHRYSAPGSYHVEVTVTAMDGRTGKYGTDVNLLPAMKTVGLVSLYNLKFLSGQDYPSELLEPTKTRLDTWAEFDIVDVGFPQVAVLARTTGRYLSADAEGVAPLGMTKIDIGDLERFTYIRNADGSISLRSVATGRYLSLQSQATPYLVASRTSIGTWEKFHEVKLGDASLTLNAHANGKFVSAESAGTQPLIASRPAANTWELFDIVDLGDGQVALIARANNRFVSAEAAGAQPLLARRVAVGLWERFTMTRNSDGSVSFKAAVNDRYVAAEGAGTKPLLAGRTAISTWEKFTLAVW